jgi:hypothetical protein
VCFLIGDPSHNTEILLRWITNGTFADYFTTGCKTDVFFLLDTFPYTSNASECQTGFTVLLIERGPGVSTKAIKTSYSPVAGTAYVTFDKVTLPP